MFRKSKIFVALILAIAIAVVLNAGCTLIPATSKAGTGPDIVKEAWDIINQEYVDPSRLNTENMTRAAIDGIIQTLHDPYTTYLTPEEYNLSQSGISGQFEGIGAVVNMKDDKVVVVSPFKDSPAEKAGIRSGDVIEAIDGESTAGMSLDIAVSKIRGPRGTDVRLTVLHQGDTAPVEITVTRDRIEVASVNFEMRGTMAYIKILQFTERTETEFAPLIPQLQQNSARGIVLDLRGNPGGLLDIVVEVASHFITDGIVVQVKTREGVISTEMVKKGEDTTDLPMVVLVDEFSASGAEVLSGALQDHGRALIAGNITYGKGSVNFLHRLSDGSGIYITASRWLTPNGRLIEGHGIDPDVKLDLTGDDAVNWAINYLKTGQR
jgi:carboxyl-terminal processing protease